MPAGACAQVRRGYTPLLNSKQQRWAAALLALTDAGEDVAHFQAALQTLPRARATPHTSAWFSALLQRVTPCLPAHPLLWLAQHPNSAVGVQSGHFASVDP